MECSCRAGEFRVEIAVFVRVDLVDDEYDRLADAAQAAGEFRIHRRKAILAIHHEEDDLGRLQGESTSMWTWSVKLASTLPPMPPVSMTVKGWAQAALRDDPIPGDAGLIVDNGNLSPREPVEQGGFADIRTPDNGNGAGGDIDGGSGSHGMCKAVPEPASPSHPRRLAGPQGVLKFMSVHAHARPLAWKLPYPRPLRYPHYIADSRDERENSGERHRDVQEIDTRRFAPAIWTVRSKKFN